jgi:hypothetical protein
MSYIEENKPVPRRGDLGGEEICERFLAGLRWAVSQHRREYFQINYQLKGILAKTRPRAAKPPVTVQIRDMDKNTIDIEL